MPKIFSPVGVAPAAAVCPYCGASIDRSPNPNLEDLPAAGDLMLCIRCAGVLVFDDLMRPQATSADELEAIYERAPEMREEVDKAQDVVHVVNAIRHTIKMKRRKAKDVPDA